MVWLYHNSLIHLSIDGYLIYSQFETFMTKASMDIFVLVF